MSMVKFPISRGTFPVCKYKIEVTIRNKYEGLFIPKRLKEHLTNPPNLLWPKYKLVSIVKFPIFVGALLEKLLAHNDKYI
jgi:hypothetical protein